MLSVCWMVCWLVRVLVVGVLGLGWLVGLRLVRIVRVMRSFGMRGCGGGGWFVLGWLLVAGRVLGVWWGCLVVCGRRWFVSRIRLLPGW